MLSASCMHNVPMICKDLSSLLFGISSAKRRRPRLPLPLLHSLSGSKQSVNEDSERGYIQPMPHMGHESVALDKLLSLPERSALGESRLFLWEDKAQNEPESEPRPSEASPTLPQGFSQSSTHLHNLTSEASPSTYSMAHSHSCESLCGMRPSPSTNDFTWDRKLPVRPSSTGNGTTSWPTKYSNLCYKEKSDKRIAPTSIQ